MNKLFNDITKGSRSRSAHFNVSVRSRLEKYPKKVRADIVTRTKYKSAPLFHACAWGKLEMVEYLISTCGADPEQKGWHGESKETVPPLWCATVSGKLPVVKCLISHGCQVDALSDGQMTALEAACFKEPAKLDIVEYLLQHGAKIDRAFHYGRTCLMQAVRNVELCRILLQYGADVNVTDMEGRTALHHAIEIRRLDTFELLLENKSDPYMRTKQGDDALQAAILYGGEKTALALMEHTSYPPERLANLYELWGSRFCLEGENTEALVHWRKAIEIRNSIMVDGKPLAKKTPEEKRRCYGYASEFTSLAELDALAGNWRAIRMQSMLIRERILGTGHRGLLSSIMDTASYYKDDFMPYKLFVHLWIRALESIDAGSTTSFETACEVAGRVVAETILLDGKSPKAGNRDIRFVDVVTTFKSLTSIISRAWMSQKNPLLEKKYRDEYRKFYPRMASCITTVMYWLISTARTNDEENEAREHVRCLIEVNPKSIPENDTFLHICVIASEWIAYAIDPEWENRSLRVTKLMLECGARVNARNANGETPLLRACSRRFSDPLNQLLVEYGAHLDTPDEFGCTPARILSADLRNTIDVESHTMTLRCQVARAIVEHEIPCNSLPAPVQEFVDLHRWKKEAE